MSHNKVLLAKVQLLNRNVPLHNKNKINNLKYSNLNLYKNQKGKQNVQLTNRVLARNFSAFSLTFFQSKNKSFLEGILGIRGHN